MYTLHNQSTKRSSFELAQIGITFCAIKKCKQLAAALETDKITLLGILQNAKYQTFSIPKPNGGERIIDSPSEDLKKVQRLLQNQLQAVYYQLRPRCVHGAIIGASDEVKPRSLLTNARAHVGKKQFLHIDLKNFYHSIKKEKVAAMFAAAPFHFKPKMVSLLTDLVCYQNRLPMGTSTSGIVANFCMLSLDTALQALATKNAWTYTRFIDDLTFSSKNNFSEAQKEEIRGLIANEGLFVNEEKWKEDSINEQPCITGLVIQGGRVDIKDTYLKQLGDDITLYRKIIKGIHLHKRNLFSAAVMQHFKQQIQGQLSFVRYIRGKMDVSYIRLQNRMKVYVVS